MPQIQANLGEGHVNVINAFEAILTESHLALVMEYAACGSLTSYVANRWQHAQHSGLFLSEDEARYFFRVRAKSQAPHLLLCHGQRQCPGESLPAGWMVSHASLIDVLGAQQFIGAVEYCHTHLVAHRSALIATCALVDPPSMHLSSV